MEQRSLMLVAVLGAAALLGGCNRAVSDVPNPIAVDAAEYDAVFDASIDVLRDLRFTVDRKDRRFGVVTTEPLIASSILEPWYADNTTFNHVVESTANFQRRTVRIEITPAAGPGSGADAPVGQRFPAGSSVGSYQMKVTVGIERRTHPPMEFNNTVVQGVNTSSVADIHRAVVTERGEVVSGWRPVGEDPEMATRLISLILNKAVHTASRAAPTDPVTTPAEPPPATPGN